MYPGTRTHMHTDNCAFLSGNCAFHASVRTRVLVPGYPCPTQVYCMHICIIYMHMGLFYQAPTLYPGTDTLRKKGCNNTYIILIM